MSARTARREAALLVQRAVEQGWRRVEMQSGWKLFSPDGVTIVVIHASCSEYRWKQNVTSELRRGGFQP